MYISWLFKQLAAARILWVSARPARAKKRSLAL
jgi:hypothetical protein